MPPDPEDLNRQLEALRRYVDKLADERERAEEAVARPAPEARRPPGRWLLVTGLLVVAALVGGLFVGAVAWSDDRPAGTGTGAAGAGGAGTSPATSAPGGTGTAAPVASPACKTAVDRANTMLATAVELRRTLAQYERILHDPANRRLSGPALRRKLDPVLRAEDGESARLDQALAAYRQVVDQCRLHTP
jgi:hypothetical protein